MSKARSAGKGDGKSRGFRLGPGVWTRLGYRAFDAEGEQVEGAGEELGLVFGYGVLLPALEAKLEGLVVGEKRSIELSARDAYGERDPALELEVGRGEFPPDVEPGDRYELERDDGSELVVRVLAVTEEGVVLDMNHPLAGQRVRFEIEVLEARPASPEELAIAESALAGAETEPEEGPERLISAADLLRRGVRS
ncbi:MAG TPA: peptidylprolyl isomerase [Polyangiaceae bacterium]|nr:peptidylprolyl isomerase [Polyangiaceae bacterium]